MEITIHLTAKKLDTDYKNAIDEYCKRTSPYCKLNVKLYKKPDALIQMLNPDKKKNNTHVLCIIPSEKTISSPDLADRINTLNLNGISSIDCIILENDNEARAVYPDINNSLFEITDYNNPTLFSISSFEFGNELCAVVLCEQIYRAYTILNNILYHK